MSRPTIRALVTAASAMVLAIGLASPAAASPTSGSPAAALDRSTDLPTLAAAESSMSDRLGGAFGNSWMDSATGKLTVGVTDASRISEIRAAGAVPKVVKHSKARLDSIVSGLNQRSASRPKSVTGWHVDAQTNSVVVLVLGSDPAASTWAATSAGGVAVRIEAVAEAPKLMWEIVGGRAIYPPDGGVCSAGFNAYGLYDGQRYLLTAGHCVQSAGNWAMNQGVLGTSVASNFPVADRGLIGVVSAGVSTSKVSTYSGSGPVKVAGSSVAPIDWAVCASGRTSGYTCGYMQSHNASVCYPEGCVYNMFRTNVCRAAGDSGGSLVSYGTPGGWVHAQGMLSGGSPCTTYFEPVNKALYYWGLGLYAG